MRILEYLGQLKLARDLMKVIAPNILYPAEGVASPIEGFWKTIILSVKGNPNSGSILKPLCWELETITSTAQSAEIWFNEMRVSAEF